MKPKKILLIKNSVNKKELIEIKHVGRSEKEKGWKLKKSPQKSRAKRQIQSKREEVRKGSVLEV